jgi:hypothetical protein
MRQTITKTELLRKILSELGSLFLALSLAIFIWVIAENEENPVIRQNFPQKIPLEIVNLSPNLATVGNLPKEVELTVVAPSAKWNSLTPEDFRAWLDLKNKPPGRYELEVMASCSVKGVKVIETRPGRVAVTLEEKDEKEMPIKGQSAGLAPAGLLHLRLTASGTHNHQNLRPEIPSGKSKRSYSRNHRGRKQRRLLPKSSP